MRTVLPLGLGRLLLIGVGIGDGGGHGAAAQQAPPQGLVSRNQSNLLLDMPGLENGRETYQCFGWNSGFTLETSYAAVVSPSESFPRAQVYMRQLAKGRL